MMTLILSMLVSSANAYEAGNMKFCAMDNNGNMECYYVTMSACQQAIKTKPLNGPWSCVYQPKND